MPIESVKLRIINHLGLAFTYHAAESSQNDFALWRIKQGAACKLLENNIHFRFICGFPGYSGYG